MEKRNGTGRGDERFFGFGVAGYGSGGVLAHAVVEKRRLVAFMAGSEVVFQGIHVRWQIRDLAEDDGKIEGYDQGYQMKTAINHADEKRHKDDFEFRTVRVEEGLPLFLAIGRAGILSSRHYGSEHQKRY